MAQPPEFKNFIAGDWVVPSTGEYFENRNPADWNDVIGRFPRSGADDLKRAVASAKRGFAQWSKTPAPIRGQVLQRVAQLLVERKDDIARAMTREMGKVVAETGGDVQEGIDTAFYAATEGRRLFGRVVPSELRNKWAMSYRRPIGIAGLITPFNFPLAIPTWKMFPALLCGNAVIFKPAEDVPHTAHLLVEMLLEKIHDKFAQKLSDRAGKLRLGPGLDAKTEVGPLIHEAARQKVAEYVDIAKKEGASVALGGRIPQGDKRLECGWFYEPTVIAGVKPGMRVEQEEIFGPVLAVIKAEDLTDAIRINNGVKYGLSSSLYTRDINGAFQAMTDLDTGITYVNAPTIGAEAHLPFGGVKQTGNGHREGGWEVYDFYSETKTIYVDFSWHLQRAQIDTESSP